MSGSWLKFLSQYPPEKSQSWELAWGFCPCWNHLKTQRRPISIQFEPPQDNINDLRKQDTAVDEHHTFDSAALTLDPGRDSLTSKWGCGRKTRQMKINWRFSTSMSKQQSMKWRNRDNKLRKETVCFAKVGI